MEINEWIACIPKAELHVHIEGTLEPELLLRLAGSNRVPIPYTCVEDVKKAYQFKDLQSFLDLYYLGSRVLVTEQDFYDLTSAYLKKACQQNVCHTEIFFDPQTHTHRGISFETVFHGIHNALVDNRQNISSHLILCFLRDFPEESALKTLQQAKPFRDSIVAVGLDSCEKGHPPVAFRRVFDKARELGFLTVAHAGEEGPPEYIWQALTILKASRIDHGVQCIQDKELVQHLVCHRIPLTVCPLSNLKLQVFGSMKDHPIKWMVEQGLCVTINSDDPAYFGGYINENFQAVADAFNWSPRDLVCLARNSFLASFLSDDQTRPFIKKLNEWEEKIIEQRALASIF